MTQLVMKARTKRSALRILKSVQSLPPNLMTAVLGKRPLRSGTSVGANYRASCRTRSTADLINKSSIVEEETDRSIYRMKLLVDGKIVKENLLRNLIDEGAQILSIKKKRNPKSELPKPKSL